MEEACPDETSYFVRSDDPYTSEIVTVQFSECYQKIELTGSEGTYCDLSLYLPEDGSPAEGYLSIIGDTSKCPYTTTTIGFLYDTEVCDFEETICFQGPWEEDAYWQSISEDEFYSTYYGEEYEIAFDRVVEEETIQYEDHSDLIVTPTYDVLEFYGIGDESDFMQITYIVTVDFETFDYYDFNGAYCILRPNWQGNQIVSLLVDPTC